MPIRSFFQRRARAAVPALLAGSLSALLGCSSEEPSPPASPAPPGSSPTARLLRQQFPERAGAVLDHGEIFATENDAFIRGLPAADQAHWGGLGFELPRAAGGAMRFSLPGGFSFHVRELGREGAADPADRAIAFRRAGGTSFWTVGRGGVEEWLHLEPEGVREGAPLAAWTIDGADLRQDGDRVLVLDGEGRARVAVTAPEAFAAGGSAVAVRLAARGSTIELFLQPGAPRGEGLLIDPSWAPAGLLNAARSYHAESRLADGRVLVTGGIGAGSTGKFAELYDPATNVWTFAASMKNLRYNHTSTLLPDGRVLVVGGMTGAGYLASPEIYDPATNTWIDGPLGVAARAQHTATLLADGRVLVAGGYAAPSYVDTASIYDPLVNQWQAAAKMQKARAMHVAALLPNGKVLVAGGDSALPVNTISATEIYDPATNVWTAGPNLNQGRYRAAAVRLANGKVLVTGGEISGSNPFNLCELYDAATNTWTLTGSMQIGRRDHRVTLLQNGQVLATGGLTQQQANWVTAELYDPTLGAWSPTASMSNGRAGHSATLLLDGRVLVAGGAAAQSYIASAELYTGPAITTCAGAGDCVNGLCVDGYCCNTACGGGAANDCQACNVPGALGTCTPVSQGTLCRAAAGLCDAPETCNGSATACPADGFAPINTPCRAAAGACDAAEVCPGNGAQCPPDGFVSDGTACNDGNACTQVDACQAGMCSGMKPLDCPAPDECHEAGTCDAQTGACTNLPKADGTPCSGGTCQAGTCIPQGGAGGGGGAAGAGGNGSGGAGAGGSGNGGGGAAGAGGNGSGGAGGSGNGSDGAGGSAGGGSSANSPDQEGSCGCGVKGSPVSRAGWGALGALLLLRRRSWRPRSIVARS